MAGIANGNPAGHFGRQMKKERLARGWSLTELGQRMGLNPAHLGRVESGRRPPTEKLAAACDEVFPERKAWFTEYYSELRTWSEVPAAFKDWSEYEDSAASLRDWWPSVVSGFLQTEDYASALLATYPGVTSDVVAARTAARMERQRRLFARDVLVWFVVDEPALSRLVGSPEIMAGQLRRLIEVAAMPNITLQVLPAIGHPAGASGFIIADDAAYTEHVAGGMVYTQRETVTVLERLFDTLRGECYRVSESGALLERMTETWTTGGKAPTPTPTVARA